MFAVTNTTRYRVVSVSTTDDTQWNFISTHDTLADATAAADGWTANPTGDCRYYVTAIGDADAFRAVSNDAPPVPV